MAKKLRPWLERFHQHLQHKKEGDIVTAVELMEATEWSPVTLKTHINKNALAPFLTPMNGVKNIQQTTFRVRRDGALITKEDVDSAITQIRPTTLNLSPGLLLKAKDADYELVAELGRGAVGQVWKCERILDHKNFATKVIDPRADLLNPSTLRDVLHRFEREAKNGPTLSHQNVVVHMDNGRYQDHAFLVMELADESLATQIETAPRTVDESRVAIACCAAGLKYLHEMKCVHRDVKPHNILRIGSRYVLGDLGIVRWSDMNPAFTSAGTITKASIQLGSWYYMAHEQREAPHEATAASDVYALGISWYEMLTGKTPDVQTVAAKAFPDPCSDSATNALIRQMVEYEQSKRPAVDTILSAVS